MKKIIAIITLCSIILCSCGNMSMGVGNFNLIQDTIYPLPFETDFDKAIKSAKSEAIKDFAERLKASQIITHRSKEGFCVYEFDDELIDTLVEEMTDKQRKEDEGNE